MGENIIDTIGSSSLTEKVITGNLLCQKNSKNPYLLCLGKRNIQALKYRFYIDERVNCIREYLKLLKQIAMVYLNNQKYT